jgi:1-acyl-sn-glycerol-3-phosphate acyltransferase
MLLRGGPLTAHVYVGAPLAPGADRRTLAAEAEAVIAGALREMQAGMTAAGAVGAQRLAEISTTRAMIESTDQPGRSA